MSSTAPPFDVNLAHRYFAAECFNETWKLIERPDRTAADDEAMVLCAMASLWHWARRPDCAARNLSIGHWQASRVLALVGRGAEAMRHGRAALAHAAGEPPFYAAYGHEAVARAARVCGDAGTLREYLAQARALAAQIAEADDRAMLEKDLTELESTGTT